MKKGPDGAGPMEPIVFAFAPGDDMSSAPFNLAGGHYYGHPKKVTLSRFRLPTAAIMRKKSGLR
jgi:hypothetical protein